MTITRTIVADIAGGQKPLAREIGSNLTIQHLWSMYRWYPGLRDIINLEIDAIFSNGINEDELIDSSRVIECKEALRWALLAGYSCLVVDARNPDNPRVEAWHPAIDGIGFQFTKFVSPKGHPLEIKISMNANESGGGPIEFSIPHYPCELDIDGELMDDKPTPGGYGFFHIRTQGNIRGVQGLPQYMNLIDTLKIQWDIIKAYAPFAEKQGMGMPGFFIEDNNPSNRANIKNQMSTLPTSNRMIILGAGDALEWMQPLAGGYDPFPMLQWLNTVIARASQMNKLMLEGDPSGNLSSSETAINNWETKNNEKQAYWRTQFIGPWIALGATEECNFKDPGHPTFVSLMEGLTAMRTAMDGLIEPEDIVNLMNEYLESNDQKRELHALPKEEMMSFGNDEEESDSKSTSDNKGSKTDKE